ncbi:hypothetical protein HK102_014046 [Quaeritorhiza haematococci]|nr:hypothetical protein HK102_014046 [Quaeritorhiza haematococci]
MKPKMISIPFEVVGNIGSWLSEYADFAQLGVAFGIKWSPANQTQRLVQKYGHSFLAFAPSSPDFSKFLVRRFPDLVADALSKWTAETPPTWDRIQAFLSVGVKIQCSPALFWSAMLYAPVAAELVLENGCLDLDDDLSDPDVKSFERIVASASLISRMLRWGVQLDLDAWLQRTINYTIYMYGDNLPAERLNAHLLTQALLIRGARADAIDCMPLDPAIMRLLLIHGADPGVWSQYFSDIVFPSDVHAMATWVLDFGWLPPARDACWLIKFVQANVPASAVPSVMRQVVEKIESKIAPRAPVLPSDRLTFTEAQRRRIEEIQDECGLDYDEIVENLTIAKKLGRTIVLDSETWGLMWGVVEIVQKVKERVTEAGGDLMRVSTVDKTDYLDPECHYGGVLGFYPFTGNSPRKDLVLENLAVRNKVTLPVVLEDLRLAHELGKDTKIEFKKMDQLNFIVSQMESRKERWGGTLGWRVEGRYVVKDTKAFKDPVDVPNRDFPLGLRHTFGGVTTQLVEAFKGCWKLGDLEAKLKEVVEAAGDHEHALYPKFLSYRERTTSKGVNFPAPSSKDFVKTTLAQFSDQEAGVSGGVGTLRQYYQAAGVFKERLDKYLRQGPKKKAYAAFNKATGLEKESDKAAFRDVLKFKEFVDEIHGEGFEVDDVLILLVLRDIGRKIITRSLPTLKKTPAVWMEMRDGIRTFLRQANRLARNKRAAEANVEAQKRARTM